MQNTRFGYTSFSFLVLLLGLYCVGYLMCCKSPAENNILDLVYIAGIHDDPEILRADSFFLKGKLEEAAELFTKYKPDVSKQLYCQARLAEMDYYLRILYGYNHSSLAVTADKLPLVNNSINTFYYAVYKFFQDETLNDTLFRSQLNKIEKVLGKNHYLVRKGQNILGEYFYRINFNLDSTTLYFREYSTWLESQQINIYDGYWTKIRLTRIGTFFRDHIESMLNVNNLLTDPTWRKLLDNVHQAYAYSKRASIFYRFDKYEEAYLDNKLAASLSEATKAIPVYQEALKSQLVVANFWLNDTLWDFNLKLLLNSVKDSGYDYVNVDKYIGSYYFERGKFKISLDFHKRALNYCLRERHLDKPSLATIAFMHAEELEFNGDYFNAIATYRIKDIGHIDSAWKFTTLVDPSLLNSKYYYVSLTRYSHIYYSWYLSTKQQSYLDTAEQLALLAYPNYYSSAESNEENQLFTFSQERNALYNVLCLIKAEKYLQYCDSNSLEDYYRYSEENRGTLFLREMKTEWINKDIPVSLLIEEQKLKALNKNLMSSKTVDQVQLNNNVSSLKKLDNFIKSVYPYYYHYQLNHKPIKFSALRKEVHDRNACLLSFNIIEDNMYVFVIDEYQPQLFHINFDEYRKNQLSTLIEWMSKKNGVLPNDYANLAFDVYSWLIPEKLKGNTNLRWSIIPDGILHSLSFDALVSSNIGKEEKFNELRWLILDKDISYSPLIKSWFLRFDDNYSQYGIVGMGWSNDKTVDNLESTLLPELPGSLDEMKMLKRAFPEAKILTGKHATKRKFIKLYIQKNNQLMHLSLHGMASSVKRDDVRLYFRNKDLSIDTFFGYELLPLISNVKEVVLSACKSGFGKITEGEGQFTIARYFLANGANNIHCSLWNINDKASSILFNKAYNNLNAINLSLKIRESKISLIQGFSGKFSHPYYWAPLISIE